MTVNHLKVCLMHLSHKNVRKISVKNLENKDKKTTFVSGFLSIA